MYTHTYDIYTQQQSRLGFDESLATKIGGRPPLYIHICIYTYVYIYTYTYTYMAVVCNLNRKNDEPMGGMEYLTFTQTLVGHESDIARLTPWLIVDHYYGG